MNILIVCLLVTVSVLATNSHGRRGHGWRWQSRTPYTTCFNDWSAWGACAAIYTDGSGADCGPQVKRSSRSLKVADNAGCERYISHSQLLTKTLACTTTTLTACTAEFSCDYTSSSALDASCTAGISSSTTLYKISDAAETPNYLKLESDQAAGEEFAYFYYPTEIIPTATSPKLFCIEYSYQIGKNMDVFLSRFPSSIETVTNKDTVVRSMLFSNRRSTYVISRDVSYTTAVKTVVESEQFSADQSFYIGFIVTPIVGPDPATPLVDLTQFKMNKMSVKEGNC